MCSSVWKGFISLFAAFLLISFSDNNQMLTIATSPWQIGLSYGMAPLVPLSDRFYTGCVLWYFKLTSCAVEASIATVTLVPLSDTWCIVTCLRSLGINSDDNGEFSYCQTDVGDNLSHMFCCSISQFHSEPTRKQKHQNRKS